MKKLIEMVAGMNHEIRIMVEEPIPVPDMYMLHLEDEPVKHKDKLISRYEKQKYKRPPRK